MATNIITSEDLENFKNEFFSRFKNDFLEELKLAYTDSLISKSNTSQVKNVRWIKSHQVRRLLNISTGKLQALRNSGKLPYSNVEGMLFYTYEDVQKMLSDHKTDFSTFK